LGNESFKKPQKLPKSPANGLSVSRSFSFVASTGCEEFRSGQKLQSFHFESAAYANFATPAAFNLNSLPKPVPKPIGLVAYLSPMATCFFESSSIFARCAARILRVA
jgi:hypothetical protein